MSAGSQNPAEFVTSDNKRIPVHFNPASLQFTITNTLEKKGSKPQQFVKESKAQLTMELVFDTTDNKTNVCTKTEEIAKLMQPAKDKVPPVVTFDWGDFTFKGIVDSYKETIDYFSPEGVPLRCTVNLSMSRQEKVFDSRSDSSGNAGGAGGGGPGSGGAGAGPGGVVDTAPQTNQSTTSVASQGGDPNAGRAIAESNGEESIRFPQSASLSIDTSVPLGPPVAFASGGAGFSLEAGFSAGVQAGGGIGISGGAGIGFGAGISGGAGIGFGAGVSGGAGIGFGAGVSGGAGIGFGAGSAGGVGFSVGGGLGTGEGSSVGEGMGVSAGIATAGGRGSGLLVSGAVVMVSGPIAGGAASAGVPASRGAFAHLRAPSLPARPARLQERRYTHRTETHGYATGSRATFEIGGMAMADSATVSDGATLRGRIRFGER